ncbi:MAG: putative DNA binding domain-containing protein [Euryarchaeota archaeon]|nr:putative DNA binding domain-containing protein [Euryarchaeota archaeon]
MDERQLDLLIREGEGLRVEFKECYTSRIAQDIVAFSNTKGGAILLGVSDDRTVRGATLDGRLKAQIAGLGRNCEPDIEIGIAQVGEVVVIEAPEGDRKPYSCSDGYYRRLDGVTQKMSQEELRVMFAESETLPYEERLARGLGFDGISQSKIAAFTREARIDIGEATPADFLRSLNLATDSGIKNVGALFFATDVGKAIRHARITLLAFKGTKKLVIYDRKDVQDDLLTQFNEAITFLMKHLNVRSEIKGVDREDIYEMPIEALREAVVNALMHRDYSMTGTQVNVEVYDDRVEIISPGGLPKKLPREKLGTMSVRRNELIADMFSRLRKVERIGLGINKMMTLAKAAGLKEPSFEANGFFKATFYRPEKPGARDTIKGTAKVTEKVTVRVTENQRAILTAMTKDRHITAKALSKIVGISERKVKENLRKLKENGLLRRVGPAKGGHWEIVG